MAMSTSFHRRVITATMVASVSVSFIVAKFSLKYVKRDCNAFSISVFVICGIVDDRLKNELTCEARLRPRRFRKAS